MLRRIAGLVLVVMFAASCAGSGSSTSDAASTTSAKATTTKLVSIGAGLKGPTGLTATVEAEGLTHVAALTQDSQGRVWAATAEYEDKGTDGVYVIAATGATPVQVISSLHTPLGLLWVGDELYVSSNERVDAYGGFDGTKFTTTRTVVTFPTGVGENNGLALAPDGRIWLGISAPCDACTPKSEYSAAVVSFLPDGTDLQVEASGIRAPIGLAYFPGTSTLYVSMNQRDKLGAKTPGDWLSIVESGQDWGFPACYGQDSSACKNAPTATAVLDKHAAASGVAIVTGELGASVGTVAVVAEWTKASVLAVPLKADGSAATGKAEPFLTGFKSPEAVTRLADGSLLVGDWTTGTVYRVAARA